MDKFMMTFVVLLFLSIMYIGCDMIIDLNDGRVHKVVNQIVR